MSHQPDQPHAGHQTPVAVATTTDDIHEITCHLQRSVRYHKARERFFEGWSNAISFISLLGGSAVVVSILSTTAPEWVALAAGGVVASVQAIEQVVRLPLKARDHSSFASEFSTLERIVTMQDHIDAGELREIKSEILSIESREPPIKRYLDLICHNQVAHAIGSKDVVKLKFWQRWLAQYLSGDSAMDFSC